MKKSIALILVSCAVIPVFAQDLTSKKGEPILPEAKDWAISIEANPFLNYVGNLFGKSNFTKDSSKTTTGNVAPTWNFLNGNNMIIGKYFKDEKTAYRIGVRIGLNNQSTKKNLADQSITTTQNYPDLVKTKEDVMRHNTTAIGLMFGIEKRRGKTRLQGFYGTDIMIWGSSMKDSYKYGQVIDPNSTNGNLTSVKSGTNTADFGTNIYVPVSVAPSVSSGRIISKKTSGGFGMGLRAFIGAEYFLLPKISLGGEFGWGIGFKTGGKTVTETETTGTSSGNTTKNSVIEEVKNGGRFVLDTDLNNSGTGSLLAPSASLRVNLHF